MAEATPSALTALIFVPGAWHSPNCYDPVVDHLKSSTDGNTPSSTFDIVKISLPSISCPRTSPSMTSWEPDINAVLDVLELEVSKSAQDCENKSNKSNVLVVSHSYGSLVANEALGSLMLSHPQISSRITLQHLILCGFMMDAGGSMRDKASTEPYPGLWDVRGDIVYPSAPAADWFYHDLPVHEQRRLGEDLEELYMPLASFTSPTRFAAWNDVPTIYLQCENDRAVPIAMQEGMISRVKQLGGLIQTAKVVSGHSPFFVVPEDVAGVIRQLVS